MLKPDVVFFGENVPAPRVARCYDAVDALAERGGALLVAGSSLTVMSGFRFVRRAAKAEIPVVVVNRGETRGDDLATYKVDVGCSEFLAQLAGSLTRRSRAVDSACGSWPSRSTSSCMARSWTRVEAGDPLLGELLRQRRPPGACRRCPRLEADVEHLGGVHSPCAV